MSVLTVEEKIIEIEEAIITLRVDGIIVIQYKEGTEVNKKLQLKMYDIFNEICGKTKRPFLFKALDYVTVTKEARDNAILMEDIFPGFATAVCASSIAYRLIANFYLNVNRPKTPYKVFNDEAKAIEWLLSFKGQ